jgi:tetratricopeptide (TPR) repeat protein
MSERVKRICAPLLLIALVVGARVTSADASQSALDKAYAGMLYEVGRGNYSVTQYSQAILSFEQALALYRAMGDQWYEGASLFYLGLCYDSLGDHPKASDYYQQASPVFRELGDRVGEAASLARKRTEHWVQLVGGWM